VSLGSNLTYTLSVTNVGTAGATGVTLTDTLPGGVTFVSASGGITPTNGVLTSTIGSLDAGAAAGFTIVVTPTGVGTLQSQASVRMNQPDSTPTDDSIARSTTVTLQGGGGNTPAAPPVVVDGPSVTAVHLLGPHRRATHLVLSFDHPLNPGRTQDLSNYQLVALAGSGRGARIKQAVHDSATQTVTLILARRLNLQKRFRLTVVGTGPVGVADLSDNLLDGQKTGHLGSNFVAIVTAADLLPATPVPRRHRVPNPR
jgi:uncharacterized repeat protein (TIGR01451 family)